MESIDQYRYQTEELRKRFYQGDSYAPNTGNFSLDISKFLNEKMKNIFDQRQRKLIEHMPVENVYRSELLS